MFCINDLTVPKLYDLRKDPKMHDNIAKDSPDNEPPPLREESAKQARV